MNIAGHIAVARLVSDDSRIWLGAALPDIATIGGFRLTGSTEDPVIAAGIRIHHRTDDAFHSSEWFRSRQSRLRAELTGGEDPVGRGPARAVAHVGPELLADGALLDDDAVSEAVHISFALTGTTAGALESLVTTDRARWLGHLGEVRRRGLPTDYNDPDAVARRLERILRRRPRLRLEPRHVEPVATALRREHDGIESTADALVSDVAARLHTDD